MLGTWTLNLFNMSVVKPPHTNTTFGRDFREAVEQGDPLPSAKSTWCGSEQLLDSFTIQYKHQTFREEMRMMKNDVRVSLLPWLRFANLLTRVTTAK